MEAVSEQRLEKLEAPQGLGKSIFPPFNVAVPMPAGTAVPPEVVIAPPTPPPSSGRSGNGSK